MWSFLFTSSRPAASSFVPGFTFSLSLSSCVRLCFSTEGVNRDADSRTMPASSEISRLEGDGDGFSDLPSPSDAKDLVFVMAPLERVSLLCGCDGVLWCEDC